MGQMTPALLGAISADRPLVFGAFEINLPGHDVRLLDGSGAVMIGGNKFTGRDPIAGTVVALQGISDGTGDEAPTITMTLQPPSHEAALQISSEEVQGSRVRISLGVLDRQTGLVVPDPLVLFDGAIDVPTIKWGMHKREVEYRVTSVFERFFELEEGIRLSDAWHQSIYPGELGLSFVTGVTETVPWGTDNIGAIVKK